MANLHTVLIIVLVTVTNSLGGITMFDYTADFCQELSPQCVCHTVSKVECQFFNETRHLRLERKKNRQRAISMISLQPSNRKNAILNEKDINLRNLNFDIGKFELKLNNFDGIELSENPFHSHTITNLKRFSYFHLNNSTIQFFYRQKRFDYICDLVIMDVNLNPIFSSFKYLFLGNSKDNTYPEEICQAVFKNARVEWLHISNLHPNNRLKFKTLSTQAHNDIESHLNAKVLYFQIQSSRLDCLDESLLDRHVFKYLERLSIEFSYLGGIHRDVFKNFQHLKRVHFWLFNFKEFIRGDNSWMNNLNTIQSQESNITEPHQQMIVEFNDESNSYTYPDSDFCLFKDFPHGNKVFPLINAKLSLNCTCTLLYLIQHIGNSEKNLETAATRWCLRQESFNSKLIGCGFKERINACYRTSRTNELFTSSVGFIKFNGLGPHLVIFTVILNFLN